MQTSDLIQTVAVVLVFLALILNVLQLRQVARQSTALRRSLEQGAYGSLVGTHLGSRTTYFLNDPELLAWHLSTRGYKSTSFEENKRRLYVLVKLEAHENNFLSYTTGLLADEVWAAWQTVMQHDFAIDEYRDIWPVAKKFYATSFGVFVENEILPIAEELREHSESVQRTVDASNQ